MSESSTILIEWMVILLFFVLVIGYMFAEAAWISRKKWTGFGKAFAFSALSNLIGLGIGFFVVFVVMMVFMMLAFENPVKDTPYDQPLFIGLAILGVLVTPIILLICKRIFLAMLKIQSGKPAWVYSLASSVLVLVVSLGTTTLIGYGAFKLF